MGSGDRIKLYRSGCFGIGVTLARFPFALTLNILFLFWTLSIGLGKGYDK